eukprot:92808_1
MFGIGSDMIGLGHPGGGTFCEQYHAYPVSFHSEKSHIEEGDKILLPSSALETLARLHVEYPMLFEVTNAVQGRKTHCGVLEFSASEGSCYLPYWMMENLILEAGSLLTVRNVSLPKATFVKFQPQHVDFLDVSNPRAVLEKTLRSFSCVTKGDHLCISYNDRKYYLEIKEVKPTDAACIIETDCNVDFDPPVGYDEYLAKQKATNGSNNFNSGGLNLPTPVSAKVDPNAQEETPRFVPFTGSGARLDGKKHNAKQRAEAEATAKALADEEAKKAQVAPGLTPLKPLERSIGRKYAKRKSQVEVFKGKGNRMS